MSKIFISKSFPLTRMLGAGVMLAAAVVVAGCASQSASSSVYTYGQAQREQVVRNGTVTAVRPITIQKDGTTGAGMVAGGAIGGVAGSSVGGGTGRTLAIIGGALLGAVAGNVVEEQVGKKTASRSQFAWIMARPV